MYKIGLSSGSNITEELFAAYQKAGIDAMEISVSLDKYDTLDYAEISRLAEKYGVKLWSFHLPFWKYDLSSASMADETVAYHSELIRKASAIGIDKFVVHPSGEPISDDNRKDRMSRSKENLARLAEFAKSCGALIAVEDLPRTCLGRDTAEMKEILDVHPDLRVCFDTNHLLTEDPCDFIRALGDKIITTHISDYDFINERHWLPGEGKVDWQAVLGAFKEINYKGVWLYEVGFGCPKTIYRERNLTCEDFVNNANEIFENKKLSVFSKPKENLGMWE